MNLRLSGKRGNNIVTIIDDADYPLVSQNKWHLDVTGYPRRSRRIKGKHIHETLHQIIVGNIPSGYVVDHINRNKLDNRRDNLRIVSHRENTLNSKVRLDNKSGYRGVCYVPRINKWRAYHTVMGRQQHLGYFKDKNLAYEALKSLSNLVEIK